LQIKNLFEKISLGTAQFGSNYGVANQAGEVALDQVADILDCARLRGVHKLDTAPSYGTSELKLGQCNIRDFQVTTKLSSISKDEKDIRGFICRQIETSLTRLNVDHIYAVLFHNELDPIRKFGPAAINELQSLKRQGVIRNIGISTYFQSSLRNILEEIDVDVIQAPFNIIDQRLNKFKDYLLKKNIRIQIRSIFLQGLLLMNPQKALKSCPVWEERSIEWQNFLKMYNLTAYEASLFYVMSDKAVDDCVVGIDSVKQLDALLHAVGGYKGGFHYDVSSLESSIKELINPYMWNKSK
jgi:aryl-alcohol dehydrogenase-like predicted oxidoreductase